MSKWGQSKTTGFVALACIVPWAVFLGGLAKLTDETVGHNFSEALKQVLLMLEWYIIAAQFFCVLAILITSFGRGLHRAHSLLNMFLAVNSILLISRATVRINQINRISDGEPASILLNIPDLEGNGLPFLRAIAAGQVATATCNFFLAILIGVAGTHPAEEFVYGRRHATTSA
ncbi:hypothetical protein TSOC_001810 [Tetrabaena socialis]|uniref:Uncharacterized protein n=1 Tax=Tetrabaena socialis TaxID=47790 RepID=A0A2J8AFX7_9CHLO|nr:hypothetical protein TSOC_001810 [Tetrabaena socialis]|eukprot:PNH11419.1 hypothetical protein TSOC_001810 [Tetrabaena socialis]